MNFGISVLALGWLATSTANAQTCSARTVAGAPPIVVELYTSEGCSSCPPADRWLSTLKGRGDVIALAFHVNYWDRLGWPDRFASAELTARQHELAAQSGSSHVYTPQVIADGRDWRQWPQLPARGGGANAPSLALVQQGDRVTATIDAAPATTRLSGSLSGSLSGYWAVIEDQHVSRVRAGENAGETLRHDHVVRLYKPVAAWPAAETLRTTLEVTAGSAEYPRRAVFVATDTVTRRPVQSLALPLRSGCP